MDSKQIDAKRKWYIPEGAIKITPKNVDAVIYLFTTKRTQKPAFVAFSGNRSKPDLNFSYVDEAQREQRVRGYLSALAKIKERKAELREARVNAPNTFAVGDIFYTMWGYDQTNVDFYEVVRTTPRSVYVRRIAGEYERTYVSGGKCRPVKGSYKGEAQLCRVGQYGITVDRHSAQRWEGKDCNWTDGH